MDTKKGSLTDVLSTIVTGGTNRVTISDGTEVTIRVCSGAALPALLMFAGKVSDDLGLSLKDPEAIKDKLLSQAENVGFVLKLIASYSEEVYSLVGGMSSLEDAEKVKALPLDDVIKVTMAVVSVNRDFFMTRVLPIFRGGKQ